MIGFEHTDYSSSLDAGTLLMRCSDAKMFQEYETVDGKVMYFGPFLRPNHSLVPAESVLGESYSLSQLERMLRDINKYTGQENDENFLAMWTFAYYTGQPHFSGEDIFLSTDGEVSYIPPLFNYEGAFESTCVYETLRPPKRAFQVNWHFFSQHLDRLRARPAYLSAAIQHFTKTRFYR